MKKITDSLNKKPNFRLTFILLFLLLGYFKSEAQVKTSLQQNMPKAGKLHNNKPRGKGWVNLLKPASDWNFENNHWQFTDSGFHGTMGKEKEHHYSYTKKKYKDFELNVIIRMVGDSNANSGNNLALVSSGDSNPTFAMFDMNSDNSKWNFKTP